MYKFNNVIIYLIGLPGTGKYTIAKEILKKTNFKLVDNYLINNPIFSLLDIDGKTIISDEIWEKVRSVKQIVFDTILSFSPPYLNFIFTNHLAEGVLSSEISYEKIKDLSLKRQSLFVPIRLLCKVEELKKRVINQDRFERFKLADSESIEKIAEACEVFKPNHPNSFDLDVSSLRPLEASNLILEKVKRIVRS